MKSFQKTNPISSSLSSTSSRSSHTIPSTLSSLSFKALEAKARYAAAMAAISPAPDTKKNKRRKAPDRHSRIERDVRAIFQSLSYKSNDEEVVKLDMTTGSSCIAMIRVYRRDDILAQPTKAAPIVCYAFYPSSYDASKLGSVAIYGNGARARRAQILKQGFLFGYPVVNVTIEMGRRPFVDVTLRA